MLALSGLLLSAILVAALVMRSKGRMPADTSARLAELQSRIRPHFLFNTLNSAIAIVRAEPAKAEALKDSGEPVRLGQEIKLAQRYLDIEKERFGERLRVEWALDGLADEVKLPPLLPLVENAVRHGVEHSAHIHATQGLYSGDQSDQYRAQRTGRKGPGLDPAQCARAAGLAA